MPDYSKIPAKIRAMNEQQTLAEMERVEELQSKRALAPGELQWLINLELRMEELAGLPADYVDPKSDDGWQYYQNLEKRRAAGEDVFGEKEIRATSNVTNLKGFDIAEQSNVVPWVLAGIAFVVLGLRSKLGRR